MLRLRRWYVRTAHPDTTTLMTIRQHRVMEQRTPVLQAHTLSQDRHHVQTVRQVKQTWIPIRRLTVCSVRSAMRVQLVQHRALRVLWHCR